MSSGVVVEQLSNDKFLIHICWWEFQWSQSYLVAISVVAKSFGVNFSGQEIIWQFQWSRASSKSRIYTPGQPLTPSQVVVVIMVIMMKMTILVVKDDNQGIYVVIRVTL